MEGLDGLIERLLEGRKCRGKRIQIEEAEIRQLCITAKDVFLAQPNLLELGAPLNVCGNFLLIFFYSWLISLNIFIYQWFRNRVRAPRMRLCFMVEFYYFCGPYFLAGMRISLCVV